MHGVKVDGDDGSEKKSQGIGAFFKPATVSPARAGGTDERLVEFVARDLRPISVVCGIGFKNLLAWLEPGYVVPSATQLTKLIQRKHQEGLEKLVDRLRCEVGGALTTDLWTSRRTDG